MQIEIGPNEVRGRIVAIVSGKGGSGKTMVAVALAQAAAMSERNAILVDADFATGGLTYYLTFREFRNTRIGLSDILESPSAKRPIVDWAVVGNPEASDEDWLKRVRLVSIGDQRRLRADTEFDFVKSFQEVLDESALLSDLVIVDCRGGIDRQSLSVCGMVDDIVLVVETDTTSIRSSQHLADMIANEKLKNRVAGFILNKVMDDPTTIAKTVGSLLSIPYLGSIPFDIDATRSYIQGKIPGAETLFCRHARSALSRIYPQKYWGKSSRLLTPEEFGTVTLKSPDLRFGNIAVFFASFYLIILYYFLNYIGTGHEIRFDNPDIVALAIFELLLLAALSDEIKQPLGRIMRTYIELSGRIFNLLKPTKRL